MRTYILGLFLMKVSVNLDIRSNKPLMKKVLTYLSCVFLPILSGCSTYTVGMKVGAEPSYSSIEEQRKATIAVRQYEKLPDNAVPLDKITVARCYRSFLDDIPSDDVVRVDLTAAAYTRGADGITNIKISTTSGLLNNCWMKVEGEATPFYFNK